MRTAAVDMTNGPLAKGIIKFSLPLILSNVLQVLFHMADLAVVGKFCGSFALGSVGSTAILVALFTGVLIGLGGAVNALTAQAVGARDEKRLSGYVHTSFVICALVGLFILIFGALFSRGVLELLGTKDELIDGAELYMRIYFMGMPALAVYNWGSAVFSAAGNTKKPMVFLIVSGVLNVALNLVFVLVCRMTVDGVAFASIISQYLSAFLVVFALIREKGNHRMSLGKLTPASLAGCGAEAKKILTLGLPAAAQNAIFYIANLFVQAGVNTFDAVMVSGNSAATNADTLVYDVMAAFYTACGSFVGQNYGAGNKKRVRDSLLISMAYAFIAAFVMGVLLVVFGRGFLLMFASEEAVIDAGMKRLSIMGLSYCVSAFMDAPIAASRALGKSVMPTAAVICGSCIFRILWVKTVFAYFGTIPSLYLLYVCSWILTAVFELGYFVFVYRRLYKTHGQM